MTDICCRVTFARLEEDQKFNPKKDGDVFVCMTCNRTWVYRKVLEWRVWMEPYI